MSDKLKLTTDTVCVTETVLDGTEELPLERDIVLPDYYPDVFRVLRCTCEPTPVSQSVSAGRLTLDIACVIRVLYLTDGSRRINCIEQNIDMSRTLELEEDNTAPEVITDLSCRGVSCRAKGSRRLDVRGIVCAAVKVKCRREKTVITGGAGGGIQLRRQTVTYPVKRLSASKRISVIQQTSLPEDKPAVGTVLRTGCNIVSGEQRTVAGKLAVKGEAELEVLYAAIDSTGEDCVRSLHFTLPYSRIIDMEGLDTSYNVSTRVTPAGCTVTAGTGEEKSVEWELDLNVLCTAEKCGTGIGITDAYSTDFECAPDSYAEISAGSCTEQKLSCTGECDLTAPDGTVGSVYDCYAHCTRPAVRIENGRLKLSGSVTCSVMGEGSEGGIFCTEGQCPYEAETDIPEGSTAENAYAEIAGCSYSIGEGGTIHVRAEVRCVCTVSPAGRVRLVSGVSLDEDKPVKRDHSCALRLCRCDGSEDIWDIAKRCHTTCEAITEDNSLPEGADSIEGGRLIVIRG